MVVKNPLHSCTIPIAFGQLCEGVWGMCPKWISSTSSCSSVMRSAPESPLIPSLMIQWLSFLKSYTKHIKQDQFVIIKYVRVHFKKTYMAFSITNKQLLEITLLNTRILFLYNNYISILSSQWLLLCTAEQGNKLQYTVKNWKNPG